MERKIRSVVLIKDFAISKGGELIATTEVQNDLGFAEFTVDAIRLNGELIVIFGGPFEKRVVCNDQFASDYMEALSPDLAKLNGFLE